MAFTQSVNWRGLFPGEFAAFDSWHQKWNPLFSEKVIERLNPPKETRVPIKDVLRYERKLYERLSVMTRPYDLPFLEKMDVIGSSDLLFHIYRTDIHLPRIFDADKKQSREALVRLEAFAAFQYFLPKLSALNAEDILEIRDRVRTTREGFSMHLQKLSKDLDGMVESGESLKDLKTHAQKLVETDLIPDYKEFRRQLQTINAGRLRKVLDAAGRIVEIDAAPWTPKFWAMLLKAFGMTMLVTAEEMNERMSNRYQAFEFLRAIDDLSQTKRT